MVNNQFPPDFLGGADLFCRYLSESLDQNGWDISILSNPYSYYIVTGKKPIKTEDYKLGNLDVFPIKNNLFKLIMNNAGYITDNRDELNKIDSLNPDVIHLHNISSFGINFLKKLKTNFDRPVVMTIHDNWFLCPFLKTDTFHCDSNCFLCPENPIKIPLNFKRDYIRFIDKLIFPSLAYFNYFNDYFGDVLPDSEVIPNFTKDWKLKFNYTKPDVIKNRYNIGENDTVVLYVGRLTKNKGFLDLIRASQKSEHITYVVVGMDKEGILKNIPENQKKNIIHTGRLKSFSKELYEWYNLSDVFFLPSYWENCPLTLIEAMCFGLPILATDVGGIPELVKDGENGKLIQLSDLKKVNRIIGNFVEKYDLERMGKKSRERYLKYHSPEVVVSKYEQVYFDLL